MNDNIQSVETELTQLTPARLSLRQRERMQQKIVAQLSQHVHNKNINRSFHWQMLLGWCGAVTVIATMWLMSVRLHDPLKNVTKEAMVFSNALEVQVVSLWENPVCSNVRLNQTYNSISFSNLPQMILPSRRGQPKI